ncbi:MAG: segregation/condensation protein A [Bdellovibrionales bacterium]|nr:segregation/condensation protein A [Bdellovibrionales bacterium]
MLDSESGFEDYSHFFHVSLEQFTGPIDLLLHLVKINELEIEKLSLAKITSQYLACIEDISNYDLEVAGEYLVIAATLLSIKSSILLNEPVELVINEDGEMVNPHDELLRRLREAEIYKEGAELLGAFARLGEEVFDAPPKLRGIPTPPTKFKDHDPYLLGKAFGKLLAGLDSDVDLYTVSIESISIVERMMTVLDVLKGAGEPVVFYKLVPDLTNRASIVGTLCALLELCKRQAIKVKQYANTEEIMIVLTGKEFDVSNLSSEFDEVSNLNEEESSEEKIEEPTTVNA